MSVLLARLALSPGRAVGAETLMDDLWSDGPPAGGADTLRRLVSRTRARMLEHGLAIGPTAVGGGYRLDVPPDEVDAHAFERLAADGARLLREHAPERAVETLEEALALWRGAPFGGVGADFARQEAPRLEDLRLAAAEDRIEALSRTGDPTGLVPELRTLCAAHPIRERCHGLLMRVLHETGQNGAALAAYEDLRRALSEELGADPSPWIGELHAEILRDRTPSPARGWSNPYLTRFVGRREELVSIDGLMDRTRLVTLLGPGGVGKTRLAAEYADRTAAARVCFVELAPLREGDSLVEAVAATLSVGNAPLAAPGRDRTARLVSALSAAPTLLVLDNCEHLLDTAADLAIRLLGSCPDLNVLTTSREPLAADGEGLVRVEPLEVPGDASEGASRGDGGEAVAMFVELASLARPGFAVDADNAGAVAEICRRLDGLPLGIELAAARTRSMTVQQIARHLNERFRLLSGPRRVGSARHRTLRAVLDWTWNLLTEHERLLARRLSVLPGGVTMSSAQEIGGSSGVSAADVPFLLSSLTDKSLLVAVESPWEEPRHRLMETPRVYLEERLRESGEEGRVRDAAARYFADLAEDSFTMLLGCDQPRGLAILDTEHDNLLESVRHACRGGDAASAVRTVTALSWYWVIRGRYEEADRWFGELDRHPDALTRSARTVSAAVRSILPRPAAGPQAETESLEEEPPGSGRAGAMDSGVRPPREGHAGAGAYVTGQPAIDAAVLADYPPLAMITPNHRLLAGDHEGVRADAETALAHPHRWVRAAGRATFALVAEAAGDAARAEQDTEAAVADFRELGDLWTTAQLAAALAGFRSARGDVDSAVASLRWALDLERSLGASERFTPILNRLGGELIRAGRADEAEGVFWEALNASEAPTAEHRIMSLTGLADLALLRGRTADARDLLARARHLLVGPLADSDYLRVVILCREGALALAEDVPERARATALRAWEAAGLLGVAAVRAEAAELLADTLWHAGDPEGAIRALGAATGIRGRRDDGSPRVRALVRALARALGEDGFERGYGEGVSGAAPPPG
ncbi:BTAD domain-containing putative transcriptional regulator [Streptomonospora salina]|uniref:Putative ATPase/DNA-binding SARP family transcriptional activator/tetratricopeptide (TPR) repeat protein n=1 Tax=Streptomonospora salina TaxID=104205 RepID=A0A841EF30_9ACTN|nr:BTAD domain-containing putative transcriptional regulator [Streptomonospora salina]MBB5999939.1 putative ATPase/DNA-binding SARP family transcriptional activator/tetratricopeptide (TPR) repeat protein [Streptomonospora salina]